MKKIVVNQEKKKELSGFEEIYDLISDKIIDASDSKSKITNDKLADNYDLYDFLDVEFKRLQKVNELLTKRLDNLKDYPQSEALIKEQTDEVLKAQDHLVSELKDPAHKVHDELSQLWKTALAYRPKE